MNRPLLRTVSIAAIAAVATLLSAGVADAGDEGDEGMRSPGCEALNIGDFVVFHSVGDTTFVAGEVLTLSFTASGDPNEFTLSIANSAGEWNEPLLFGSGPEGEPLIETYTFDGSERGVYVEVTPAASLACSAAPMQSTTTSTTTASDPPAATASGHPTPTAVKPLPETGRTSFPMLILAAGLFLTGAALATAARRQV